MVGLNCFGSHQFFNDTFRAPIFSQVVFPDLFLCEYVLSPFPSHFCVSSLFSLYVPVILLLLFLPSVFFSADLHLSLPRMYIIKKCIARSFLSLSLSLSLSLFSPSPSLFSICVPPFASLIPCLSLTPCVLKKATFDCHCLLHSSLPLYLSLPIWLQILLYVSTSVKLSIGLFCHCLSVFLPTCLSIFLSVCLSIYLNLFLFLSLCVCLYQPPLSFASVLLAPPLNPFIRHPFFLFLLFFLLPVLFLLLSASVARTPNQKQWKNESNEKQREEKMRSHHQKYVWIPLKFSNSTCNYCCLALCKVDGEQNLNQPYQTWPAIWVSPFLFLGGSSL